MNLTFGTFFILAWLVTSHYGFTIAFSTTVFKTRNVVPTSKGILHHVTFINVDAIL